MHYLDSTFDELLEPYFHRLEEEFLPQYQMRIGDYSDEAADEYKSFIRRRYRLDMLYGMIAPGDEVMLPEDVTVLEAMLQENYEDCRYNEIDVLKSVLTDWLIERMEPPVSRTKADDHKIAKFGCFVTGAASLVLATVLGKVSPDLDNYGSKVAKLNELVKDIPDEQWKTHPMLPKSPFVISDTIENLRCAYGQTSLWKAPVFRDMGNLRDAGPLDEGTLFGWMKMCHVRTLLGEEMSPLPNDVDWEAALRDDDDSLLYGDWKTEMPADMAKALEWYEKARQEGESSLITAE